MCPCTRSLFSFTLMTGPLLMLVMLFAYFSLAQKAGDFDAGWSWGPQSCTDAGLTNGLEEWLGEQFLWRNVIYAQNHRPQNWGRYWQRLAARLFKPVWESVPCIPVPSVNSTATIQPIVDKLSRDFVRHTGLGSITWALPINECGQSGFSMIARINGECVGPTMTLR